MVQIILTIPDEKIEEFKLGFLKEYPVPLDKNGDPLYSVIVWVKKIIIDFIITGYCRGKKRLAFEMADIIESIIE